jgi:hypothetical protein
MELGQFEQKTIDPPLNGGGQRRTEIAQGGLFLGFLGGLFSCAPLPLAVRGGRGELRETGRAKKKRRSESPRVGRGLTEAATTVGARRMA